MGPDVRRPSRRSLRALCFVIVGLSAFALPAFGADSVSIALHLTPGRYERTEKLVHVVTFDMNKTLKNLAGSRADDKTILEDRDRVLVVRDSNAVSETETNTRRYGGTAPKEQR